MRAARQETEQVARDEAPAWARGLDIPYLKHLASIYKQDFKPYTFGAFGLPKERDIADAIVANELAEADAAVCIARFVSRPSPHHDFAGRTATLQAGDFFIRSLAGSHRGKRMLLMRAADLDCPVWVEAHVENKITEQLLFEFGFERILTKVAASSDLKGLYLRGPCWGGRAAPPEALADIPAVRLLKPAFASQRERSALLAEIEAYGAWAQHYSGYNKRSSWTAFALQGFDPADPGFIIKPAEMSKAWKAENPERLKAACAETKAAAKFPTAMKIAARVPGRKERIRLMRLSAGGGELSRHADITDPDAGTKDNQTSRLHIPLITNPQCIWHAWNMNGEEETLTLNERDLSYVDTRKPHAVTNGGPTDRIHLVMDTFGSNELRSLIAA